MWTGKRVALATCVAGIFVGFAAYGAEDVTGVMSEGFIKEIDGSKLVIYHMQNADPATEKEFHINAATIFCVDDKIVNTMEQFAKDSHVGVLVDQEKADMALYLLSGAYELTMAGGSSGFVSMDAMPMKSKCQ